MEDFMEDLKELKIVTCFEGSEMFLAADEFCTRVYWVCEILKRGQHFSKKPDVYFVALLNGKVVETLGAFLKHTYGILPLEEVYDFITEENSVELGRFSLNKRIKKPILMKITQAVIYHTANYMIDYFGEGLKDTHFYIETFGRVEEFINESMEMEKNILTSTDAKIINIPKKSEHFYKNKNPKIFRINKCFARKEAA